MNTDMAMVPYHEIGMVAPLVNPAAAKQAIQQYEALKASIVQPNDIQKIQGRDFLKKAFWRRVAACFGLSLDLVSESRGHDEKGGLFYSVIYKAVAPNGRTMTADGYCSTSEPGRQGWPEHNVRATAHTRAKNRAISDLVGGGEVSADEMTDYVEADPAPRIQEQEAKRSWASLRIIGNQLGWSVTTYDEKLWEFLGRKPANKYTVEEFNRWADHLEDELDAKHDHDGNLSPDPEQPHDLREVDMSKAHSA